MGTRDKEAATLLTISALAALTKLKVYATDVLGSRSGSTWSQSTRSPTRFLGA